MHRMRSQGLAAVAAAAAIAALTLSALPVAHAVESPGPCPTTSVTSCIGALSGVQAKPGDGSVTVTWDLPSDPAITSVLVTVSNGAGYAASPILRGITIGGLDNGTTYTFEVRGVAKSDAGAAVIVEATPQAADVLGGRGATTPPAGEAVEVAFVGSSSVISAAGKRELALLASRVRARGVQGPITVIGDGKERRRSEQTKLARARARAVISFLRAQGVDEAVGVRLVSSPLARKRGAAAVTTVSVAFPTP